LDNLPKLTFYWFHIRNYCDNSVLAETDSVVSVEIGYKKNNAAGRKMRANCPVPKEMRCMELGQGVVYLTVAATCRQGLL